MKALIYVMDTSLKGEYSTVVQLLGGAGYDIDVAVARADVEVNPSIELEGDRLEGLAERYSLLALVGGYATFYVITGKRPPRRDWKRVANPTMLRKLVGEFVGRKKTVLAPFMTPALIASYGYLKGRKATVYPLTELIRVLVENGAIFVNEPYVSDGGIVTVKNIRETNIKELVDVIK